mmetsp:Transcript_143264/g.445313  ORF Transcript_143264/g.445313 Transcript_143264/m.445313 type:complete len:474 (+) Transcript_143264:138-1559(+)
MACSVRFIAALVASILLHLTFGTVYCWGNIAPYVVSYMRMLGHEVDYDEMSWAVSLTTALQAVSMLLGGGLHPKLGLHKTAALGCCVSCLGIGLSSLAIAHGKGLFLFTYAIMFGLGIGLGYIVPILVLMKWLPKNRGLASGIVVAGFGAGAFVFNKVQEEWINPLHLMPRLEVGGQKFFDWHNPDIRLNVLDHVPSLLWTEGLIFAGMQFLGLVMLFEPEEPALGEGGSSLDSLESNSGGRSPRKAEVVRQSQVDMNLGQMLRSRHFWLLIATVFCDAQVVLIMAASQKTFGLELLPAVSDDTLTNLTGLASLLNGLGRIAWGTVGDLTSFRIAMAGSCTALCAMLATLPFVCVTPWRYGLWLSAIFFCIGGFFSLFPLATSTLFGPEHMGSNYGAVFLGVAVSELISSVILQFVLGARPVPVTCETLAVLMAISGVIAMQLRQGKPEQAEALLAKQAEAGYGGVNRVSKIK